MMFVFEVFATKETSEWKHECADFASSCRRIDALSVKFDAPKREHRYVFRWHSSLQKITSSGSLHSKFKSYASSPRRGGRPWRGGRRAKANIPGNMWEEGRKCSFFLLAHRLTLSSSSSMELQSHDNVKSGCHASWVSSLHFCLPCIQDHGSFRAHI